MISFWRGHSGANGKGVHWLSSDKLSMHKCDGDMSFKSIFAFNLVILGKQGWKIVTNPVSLVVTIIMQGTFLNAIFLNPLWAINLALCREVYATPNSSFEHVVDGE